MLACEANLNYLNSKPRVITIENIIVSSCSQEELGWGKRNNSILLGFKNQEWF